MLEACASPEKKINCLHLSEYNFSEISELFNLVLSVVIDISQFTCSNEREKLKAEFKIRAYIRSVLLFTITTYISEDMVYLRPATAEAAKSVKKSWYASLFNR